MLALSIACATPPGPSLGSAPPDELFEAVFRYQVEKTPRDVLKASEVLFFQVDDEDPPADLLDRLSDLPLPALPHSVMQSSKIVDLAEPTRFVEKGTGRRGYFFWAGNVTRLNDHEAVLSGCYGSVCSTFLVRKVGDMWKVVNEKVELVS